MIEKSQIKLNLIIIVSISVFLTSMVLIFFLFNIQRNLTQYQRIYTMEKQLEQDLKELERQEEELMNQIEQLKKVMEKQGVKIP